MQKHPLLTPEELDFIQNLRSMPRSRGSLSTPSLRVDGGTQTKDLLTRLAAQDQLTIEAHFNGERITFPLQLVEDEFHSMHLQLGTPNIVEPGSADRPWRLPLAEPIGLLDENGAQSGLWLHSISLSGMLIEVRDQTPQPKRFTLWLPLPGQAPIELRGILARTTEQRLVAYRLTLRKTLHSERLRQFIFQQHRLLNPISRSA
ncbi:MAG: PilZ domain-containing protein [Pseudomonas sp.]